ncbi:cucumisin-like [Magnolia sinica]|uniref:cucumisin-like n=1 Tax=Magnolia sinica TaxID=86752 RepID=UPI0026598D6E|nr:cucumisin-like [Magnolia sinica]
MGALPKDYEYSENEISLESLHHSILEEVLEGSSAKESIIYSYKKSFNGFAARLTEQEKQKIAGMEGIVSVFPSKTHKLHTTRSWNFMGFSEMVRRQPDVESDIIIGMLDSGIWPESDSFNDEGMGPPPSKWKGFCVSISCNNKIIGARFYKHGSIYPDGEDHSPRDTKGHGTHTSSTAAGREVRNANFFHLARGTARGAVPSARLAVYKVCWGNGCADADIFAAFDDAIHDGVDLISVSIGGMSALPYFRDTLSIGSFHAMKNGIFVSMSAGNGGPESFSATNVAPWILSVGASSIDRRFTTKLTLGNQRSIVGVSVNTFATEKTFGPFIFGADAANSFDSYTLEDADFFFSSCSLGTLDPKKVKGKIVYCNTDRSEGEGPYEAGARGSVMIADGETDSAFSYVLPNLVLTTAAGKEVSEYLNKTRNPVARIHKSGATFDRKAPQVVSFSSRGPNSITPDVLKPDITAPGVDILAAWSPKGSITGYEGDTRQSEYNIISGTSMACPHATGAAAYVKSFNPSWSPAAIKSALMTTAFPMDYSGSLDHEFSYGAGHINPKRAVNPGLVYDATEADYIQMLCNQGYDAMHLLLITGESTNCPNATLGFSSDLNYPSMASAILEPTYFTRTFPRTVTNVGPPNSKYKATIKSNHRVNITVEPSVLHFKSVYEKLSFTVTVMLLGEPLDNLNILPSSLVWSDGKHRVRSPIVVYSYYESELPSDGKHTVRRPMYSEPPVPALSP